MTSAWRWTATPIASRFSTRRAGTFRSTICCCCSTGICMRCAANAAAWCATWPRLTCSTVWRARMGEQCYEVPVGFKHIVNVMQQHNALLGGESSGGLTIRGHILGKDGIFASALVVEMLARTGQRISELRDRVYAITGPLYDLEEGIPATPEMRIAVPRRLKEAPSSHIGRYPVIRISYADGTKMFLENDNWALLRFSGTEPVLRLSGQADTEEKARELIEWLRQFVTAKK